MKFEPGIPPTTFTPEDDDFHAATDETWFTEACWFSFHVPERKLSSWLYGFVRPNVGICTASVFVYDETGSAPYEALFHEHQQAQPLPRDRDLRDFRFPEGYQVKMLEPMHRYQLSYQKADLISVDLKFEEIMEPHQFSKDSDQFGTRGSNHAHFDQFGHLTGTLVLRGESIPVDCYSIRDRSWGPRTDSTPAYASRLCYDYGCTRDGNGFCTFSTQSEVGEGGSSAINHGFWLNNGKRLQVVEGVRTIERNARHPWATKVVLELLDVEGNRHRAVGRELSHFLFTPARWITSITFMEWDIDGKKGWGEDQDLWRYDEYSLRHRQLNYPDRA